MIELQKHHGKCFLMVNGNMVAESPNVRNKHSAYEFQIKEDRATELISGSKFDELPRNVERIHMLWFRRHLIKCEPTIYQERSGKYSIEVGLMVLFGQWTQRYTPVSFTREIKSIVLGQWSNMFTLVEEEDKKQEMPFAADLLFRVHDSGAEIGETITSLRTILKEIEVQAATACLERVKGTSLATYFAFPEEVKSACEQYLLYFGNFLRDVGIGRWLCDETEPED